MSGVRGISVERTIFNELYAEEIVEAYIHTILLHRTLGGLDGQAAIEDKTCPSAGVTYVKLHSEELDAEVTAKVKALVAELRQQKGVAIKAATLHVEFVKRAQQGFMSFASRPVPWEDWIVRINVDTQKPDDAAYLDVLSEQVTNDLMFICSTAIKELDHLPSCDNDMAVDKTKAEKPYMFRVSAAIALKFPRSLLRFALIVYPYQDLLIIVSVLS
eukprot:m.76129 g.76129  ORF g.76129 m.76129 type:complete len:216 (-) comp12478_c0_seq3:661-1308(-)